MLQTELKQQVTMLVSPVVQIATIEQVARQYVVSQIDARFIVGKPQFLPKKNDCWLLVQYQATGQARPIGVGKIHIDMRTGQVIPLTDVESQLMREKADLLASRQDEKLPVDKQGWVLKEFARKQANRYLWDHLGMFYRVCDLNFVSGEPPLWRATIVFKQYELGPFSVGTMIVDAKSGEIVPLPLSEIEKIQEVVHAFIGHHPSPTDPS